ncbi:MAG: hypothetical protein LAN84_06785 [Acidobacteriia bacterium]|nr:hypothetical protein [Terriglobia bacterium]
MLVPQVCAPAQTQSVLPREPAAQTKSLFAQSAVQVLEREFTSSEISFLLLDARSGVLLSSRWEEPEKPIPFGSLVKPFTALAYAESHAFQYPVHLCRGEASGCWQIRGHGKLDIVSAIAHSCNSYFRVLAAALGAGAMQPVARRFGLEEPDAEISGAPLMGLGEGWRIAPLHMARAYLELVRRREQPGVRELLAGMGLSARQGTGAGVGRALLHSDALVKTGTAPCTHAHPASGDGFVIVLVPAAQPELLLLVCVHGVPGATAAVTAGRMVHRLEE